VEYVRYVGMAAFATVGRSAAGTSREAIDLGRADMLGEWTICERLVGLARW
jgi:hypothetical protein